MSVRFLRLLKIQEQAPAPGLASGPFGTALLHWARGGGQSWTSRSYFQWREPREVRREGIEVVGDRALLGKV